MAQQICLIGFMGSGKTTVGRLLAKQTGRVFTDTDEMIVEREGTSINEIFSEKGEPYFRDLETETLKLLLNDPTERVISVGGGLPVREENRDLMKELGQVVYLEASQQELVRRLSGDKTRPLLQGGSMEEKIRDLMEKREALYLDAATLIVKTDGKSPRSVAREITGKVQ